MSLKVAGKANPGKEASPTCLLMVLVSWNWLEHHFGLLGAGGLLGADWYLQGLCLSFRHETDAQLQADCI